MKALITRLDHLIPLELGGSNSIKNLWPGVLVAVPLKTIVEIRFKARIVVCTKEKRLKIKNQITKTAKW
jgi:hypothetical protein